MATNAARNTRSQLDATFAALADPKRRAILARLARGEASVGELARPFDISLPAVSRHLRVLEQARLIERRIDAQRRVCRLRTQRLRAVAKWIDGYRALWDARLEAPVASTERSRSKRRRS